jgi:DNA helicase-2/ATP-dependent DNA helicase PcrA
MQDLRVEDAYAEEASPDNNPMENLQELVKIAGRYTSIKDFLDYTRRASQASKRKSGIALSTVHQAKGLEYDAVFFIGVQEGLVPHSRSESLEEEKCIFHVGISRAKQELYISYAGIPSPFIKALVPRTKQQEELDNIFEGVFADASG